MRGRAKWMPTLALAGIAVRKWMSAVAAAGAIALSLSPEANAGLQAAVAIDGGASLLACDQNLCAGGAVPTFADVDAAVGSLATLPATLGDISVSFTLQTSTKGPVNTLSSSGTAIENTGAVAHSIQLTVGDINYVGPSVQFTTTGSGTWVDPNNIAGAFGGSTITMQWFNDPLNGQGAEAVGDTPGNQVTPAATSTPVNGAGNNQSFGGPATAFNASGPLAVPDPGIYSMTLDNELVLGPGIRLESRGQAESKPLAAVPAPATLLLLGSALGFLAWRRFSI